MSWLKKLLGGSNSSQTLSKRFERLLQAKTAQDIEQALDVRPRARTLEEIDGLIKQVANLGQRELAVILSYGGIVLTLQKQDWLGCYACVNSAFYHGFRADDGRLMNDVLATTWPILAHCETRNPEGAQFFNIAMIMQTLAQAGKEYRGGDQGFYESLQLAMAAVGILYGRAAKLNHMPFEATTDPVMTAFFMEQLGLRGVNDWVRDNLD